MIKKIGGTFFVRFSSAIINLLIAVVISRYLGAPGKGEQGILIATISFVLLFDNLVGGATVVYLTPRLKLKGILLVSYAWSALVSVIAFLILKVLGFIPPPLIISVAILSGISSMASINSSILIGKEEIWKSNIVSFINPATTIVLVLGFFLILGNVEIESYILALYVSYIVGFLLSFYFVASKIDKAEELNTRILKDSFISLLKYGSQNQLAHVFQLLNFRLSFYFLENYWGSAAVGIYSNGVSIIESIWMISGSITLYQYSRIVNTTDGKYAIDLTMQLTRFAMLIAFLVIIPIVLLPSAFYIWIFGPDFSELNKVIFLLAPGVWFFNYALIIGHYFSGTGRYYINTIASGIGFILIIPALVILVPAYHFLGAAVSASFSYLCTSLVVVWYFKKSGGKFILFPSLNELRNVSVLITTFLKKNLL
jgi:O-antigen/teichoic acid export membrane protein